MDIPRIELQIWHIAAMLALIEIALIALFVQRRYVGQTTGGGLEMRGTGKSFESSGQEGVRLEIERLRRGGEIDNQLINNLSQEDRILFEVAIIDALTKWPIEERARLRHKLIKYGFDEQCVRRLLRPDVSDHIRASTIIGLLKTQ